MKVAIIQCPVWGTYDPPMALSLLSACLKRAGLEVFALDLNIKLYNARTENYKSMWAWEQCMFWYDSAAVDSFFSAHKAHIEQYINELITKDVKVAGFSVSAASWLSSLRCARLLKKRNAGITIIFGGPLFFEKRFIDEILSEHTVDIVIPGEAEEALPEVVNLLKSGNDLNGCKGICFKENGTAVATGARPLIRDLDSLPFLDFSDLPLSDYDDSKHLVFMASRGCAWKCVFCSSNAFWPGFRAMSGRRIFEEIKFHKLQEGRINPTLGHVDFLDLMFNGNIKHLVEFCDLMINAKLDLNWSANMIIRPEITLEVIKKIKDSGCKHIIFGVESGSEKVLRLMRKPYRIDDANRIIRQMHEAGIVVTGNFMFGFPGETEDDFKSTLEFLKRNYRYLDRAYPSRTYCALEESSYLASHLEEFGIKPNPPNHLFWESVDGTNNYPERLRRCSEFSLVASSLGIEVGCGVQTSVVLEEFFNLFEYYEFKKDYENALTYLLKYFELDSVNERVRKKLVEYFIKNNEKSFIGNNSLLRKLTAEVYRIKFEKSNEQRKLPRWVVGRERSPALLESVREENLRLNDEEFLQRKSKLFSSPTVCFLEIPGKLGADWVLGKREDKGISFDFEKYRSNYEEKISPTLAKAKHIGFWGCGEFLLLPDSEKILEYFDEAFPHVPKVIFTDGYGLSPRICDKMIAGKSTYIINVSLPASNASLYRLLSRTDNFSVVINQIKHLLRMRNDRNKVYVQFDFALTTLNIEDAPCFVNFAADMGVDKVVYNYIHIYSAIQTYLSCFFKQDITNKMLDEAQHLAVKQNMKIEFPPRFSLGSEKYPVLEPCKRAWNQIILRHEGDIIPCQLLYEAYGNLKDKNIMEIWNSKDYQKLRENFAENKAACFTRCFLAHQASVNDFRSHVACGERKSFIDELEEV